MDKSICFSPPEKQKQPASEPSEAGKTARQRYGILLTSEEAVSANKEHPPLLVGLSLSRRHPPPCRRWFIPSACAVFMPRAALKA
jgi:hypothetical protein